MQSNKETGKDCVRSPTPLHRSNYKRSILNVIPYRPAVSTKDQSKEKQNLPQTGDNEGTTNDTIRPYRTGEIIAVLDNDTSKYWWLARIQKIENDHLVVQYFATRSATTGKAKFRPVFVLDDTRQLSIGMPSGHERQTYQPWLGTIPLEHTDQLVLSRHLTLSGGRLNNENWTQLKLRKHATLDPTRKDQ